MLAARAAQRKRPVIGHVSKDWASSVIGYRIPFTLGHCGRHHIVMTQNSSKLSARDAATDDAQTDYCFRA